MSSSPGYARLYAEDIQKYEGAELIAIFGSVLRKKEFMQTIIKESIVLKGESVFVEIINNTD